MHPSEGEATFLLHCRIEKLNPIAEYQFDPDRKWRADFCFLAEKLLVEIEGGIWLGKAGGHTSGKGMEANMEKYNRATVLGFKLLRFSSEAVKSGKAIKMTKLVLADTK